MSFADSRPGEVRGQGTSLKASGLSWSRHNSDNLVHSLIHCLGPESPPWALPVLGAGDTEIKTVLELPANRGSASEFTDNRPAPTQRTFHFAGNGMFPSE